MGLKNTAGYAGTMKNIGTAYERQGQRDMAGRYFRMAYDIYVKSGYSGKLRDDALNNARRLGYWNETYSGSETGARLRRICLDIEVRLS
ncbi:MAG: hypothetical protein R6V76_00410 [Desulfobacterales bacterium]